MAKKAQVNNREVALENLKATKELLEKDYAEHPHQTMYTIITSIDLEILNLTKLIKNA